MARQGSHWPQGSVVGPPVPSGPTQFSPLAMIRAVVVLPVPRMPVITKAWAIRSAAKAIPSFEAIAAYCLRNGFALNIEIKPTPGQELETGRVVAGEAARLWSAAGERGAVPPLLSSFRPEALQGARETAPALPRALLLDTLWDGWFDIARTLGCVACVTNHKLMDAALIAQLRGAGLRALVYTVNDAGEARRLAALGIDGIITDAVDRFSPGDSVRD